MLRDIVDTIHFLTSIHAILSMRPIILFLLAAIFISSLAKEEDGVDLRVANAFSTNILSGMTVLPQEIQISTIMVFLSFFQHS